MLFGVLFLFVCCCILGGVGVLFKKVLFACNLQ